ncbi:MAG: CDP-alcohol phosphatidyltransferase family protein [Acidobacteriota bacterium]|nr:CDP-alcohol phosphatidyltransferase family protein [Acidobacteriota bacterium]
MKLFSDFKRSLKLPEVEEIFDLLIFRPLGYLLVKAIYRTRITPNQITFFSILIGVAAGVCFGVGTPGVIEVGAAFYIASIIFDCADGQLARLKKNGTRLGRLLDGFVDYITEASVFVGVALGLRPEGWIDSRWWVLLAAAVASTIFHAMLLDYYRNRFLNIVNGFPAYENEDYHSFKVEREALRVSGKHPIRRRFIAFYLYYLEIQRRLTLRRQPAKTPRPVDPADFRKANGLIMRLWTILGTSTQIVMLTLCILFRRLDVFFWIVIVVLNIVTAVLFFIQTRIDIRLEGSVIE